MKLTESERNEIKRIEAEKKLERERTKLLKRIMASICNNSDIRTYAVAVKDGHAMMTDAFRLLSFQIDLPDGHYLRDAFAIGNYEKSNGLEIEIKYEAMLAVVPRNPTPEVPYTVPEWVKVFKDQDLRMDVGYNGDMFTMDVENNSKRFNLRFMAPLAGFNLS